MSRGLAEAVGVALAAARWTGGRTHPTVGPALAALGYDRDFASVGTVSVGTVSVGTVSVGTVSAGTGSAGPVLLALCPLALGRRPGCLPPGRCRLAPVRLHGRLLRLPAGIRLDLGATGKGLGAHQPPRGVAGQRPRRRAGQPGR